jgi:hypothetical protein
MFEYLLEHIFDTCLRPDESMKLGEVDKFCIDSDFRKKYNQPEKGNVRGDAREHRDAANPIRKRTLNREGNDIWKTPNIEHPLIRSK